MGILDISKYWHVFQDKNKRDTAKHRQNPEQNLLQSALHQRLREQFTFQQDNNLQNKAKSTLELLTKTVNVPVDLNLLEILNGNT
jgi:hypothetical protein